MKTYCRECLKKNKEGSSTCARCGEQVSPTLSEEEIRPFVQRLHKKVNVSREHISTGLSSLVIGLTMIIIGAIFYRLSYKLDQSIVDEVVFVLATNSAEFWVSLICLIGGGILAVFGSIWSIFWGYTRRAIYHDVDEIRATKSLTVSRTPTIFEVWAKHIGYFCRQTIHKIKRRTKKEGK